MDSELLASEVFKQPFDAYVVLDPLDEQKPVDLFYQRGWVERGGPLYFHTPMESILKASPWLIKLKPETYIEIEQWIKKKPSLTWGWLYSSQQNWNEQLSHWKQYLRVIINEQLRVLRFQDSRILELWLSENEPQLWQYLLAPIESIYMPSGKLYMRRNHGMSTLISPWVLPASLINSWGQSCYGIKVKASNLEMELWENQPEKALELSRNNTDLEAVFVRYLTKQVEGKQLIAPLLLSSVLSEVFLEQ